MKKSKFTEEQIIFALKQAENGITVEEISRKLGITAATFYLWKKKCGGLRISRFLDAFGLRECKGQSSIQLSYKPQVLRNCVKKTNLPIGVTEECGSHSTCTNPAYVSHMIG